jgi:hypothetical protein
LQADGFEDFAVAIVVREVQPTPNPNAMKFVLDVSVSPQPMSFLTPASASNHPLAQRLFAVPGVTSVLLLGDFCTINKSSEARWPDIKRNVEQVFSST